jgi:hypothetical protein
MKSPLVVALLLVFDRPIRGNALERRRLITMTFLRKGKPVTDR